jgi:hypothetical protein
MSALTTAAIIGLTAANAGAGIAEAAIKGHQTSKAVDAQTAAANKALAVQQQVYSNQQQAAAPYQQTGQQTLGRLGQMAAQPANQFSPANYQQGAPTAAFQAQQPSSQYSNMMGGPATAANHVNGPLPYNAQGNAPGAGLPSAQMPSLGALGQPPGQSMPGMAPGGQGDTVTIQTPDGRTLQGFPRARVQEAMQRGAKVVG